MRRSRSLRVKVHSKGVDRAVVDDPEDALGRTVGIHGHHPGVAGLSANDPRGRPGRIHPGISD